MTALIFVLQATSVDDQLRRSRLLTNVCEDEDGAFRPRRVFSGD